MAQAPPAPLPQPPQGPLPSQASPVLHLLSPQRTSSVLRTQRPATGHVSQFRAQPGLLSSPDSGIQPPAQLGHMGSHQATYVWQKQMTDFPNPSSHPNNNCAPQA